MPAMSRSLSVLRSSLSPLTASSSSCPQRISSLHIPFNSDPHICTGTRGYAQALLKTKSDFEHSPHTPDSPRRGESPWGDREKFGQEAQPTPLWKLKSDPQFSDHLNGLFSPLEFNPEAARRCLTHASHPSAVNGHNQGMSFLGMLLSSL